MSKSNKQKDENELLNKQRNKWRDCLIREEFLKIYFDEMGIKERVNIENLINNFELLNMKTKKQLLFAIVRNSITSDSEEKEKTKTYDQIQMEQRIYSGLNMKIFSPEPNILKDEEYSDLGFMELAYSGLLFQDTNLFMDNCLLMKFREKLNKKFEKKPEKKKGEDSKENMAYEIEKEFLFDEELLQKHNEICLEVFGESLENARNLKKSGLSDNSKEKEIEKEKEKEKEKENEKENKNKVDVVLKSENYSLFFTIDGKLVEYIPAQNLFNVVKDEGITEGNMAKFIGNHLIESNENAKKGISKISYFDEIFIFTENQEKIQEEVENTASIHFIINLITTILFLCNFLLLEMPEKVFYEQKMFLGNFLNYDNFNNLTNRNDVYPLVEEMLYTIVNKRNSFNRALRTSNNDEGDNCKDCADYYYLNNEYFFNGLLINYQIEDGKSDSYHYFGPKSKIENSDVDEDSLYTNSKEIFYSSEEKSVDKLNEFSNSIAQMKKLYLTVMFTNLDIELTSVDRLTIEFQTSGNIKYSRNYSAFKSFINRGSNYATATTLNIFIILALALDFARTISVIWNKITIWRKNNIIKFTIFDVLDICTIILALVSQGLFYRKILFNSKNEFPIIFSEDDEFKKWVKIGFSMKTIMNLTAITSFLMCLKLIVFIYDVLPSLGLIFTTISRALKEIASLYFIIILMIISFMFLFQGTLGGYSLSFYSFGNSFNSVYLLFIGLFDFQDDYKQNNQMHPYAPYLWFLFYFIFHLILGNLFLCMIRNTFKRVKEEKEMFSDSLLKMSKETFISVIVGIKRLVTCYDEDNDEDENFKENEMNEDINNEDDNNNYQAPESHKEYGKLITKNFMNLNLGRIFKSNVDSLEEFESKKRKKYKEIRKELMESYLNELNKNTLTQFVLMKDTIYFCLFIIFFLISVYLETHISDRDQLQFYAENKIINNKYVLEFLEKKESEKPDYYHNEHNDTSTFVYTFPGVIIKGLGIELATEDEINNCSINKDYIKHCEEEQDEDDSEDKKNICINEYNTRKKLGGLILHPYKTRFRVTYRLYNYKSLEDEYKKKYLPRGIESSYSRKLNFLDSKKCPYPYEIAMSLTATSGGIEYTNPNNGYQSYDDCGGFVELIDDLYQFDVEEDEGDVFKYIFETTRDQYENALGSITLDFAIFSDTTDAAIYVIFYQYSKPYGVTKRDIDINIIPINRYYSYKDFTRTIVEIFYYFFFIYFIISTITSILEKLEKLLLQNYRRARNRKLFVKSSILNKFYRFSIKEYQNKKGVETILSLIFMSILNFIAKTVLLVFLFIYSIIQYITEGLFNFLDLFSLCLCIGMMGLWGTIINETNRLDFTNEIEANINHENPTNENLEIINHLKVLYNRYSSWQAFNLVLFALRLIKYFQFSSSFSLIMKVFSKSCGLVLLFSVVLLIINLGFSIFSYGLFSQDTSSYHSVGSSIYYTILLLITKMEPKRFMYMESENWRPVYYFFFFTFNSIVLMNIFYSIMIESFNETKERQIKNKEDENGILNNLYSILSKREIFFLRSGERYKVKLNILFDEYVNLKSHMISEIHSTKVERIKSKSDGMKKISLATYLGTIIQIKRKFYKSVKKLSQKSLLINNFELNANKSKRKNKIDQQNKNNIEGEGEENKKQDSGNRNKNSSSNDKEKSLLKLSSKLSERYKNKLNEEISIYQKMLIYYYNKYMDDVNYKEENYKNSLKKKKKEKINSYINSNVEERMDNEKGLVQDKKDFSRDFSKVISSKINKFFHPSMLEKYYSYTKEFDNETTSHDSKYNFTAIPRFSKESNIYHHEILDKNYLFYIPSFLNSLDSNNNYSYLSQTYRDKFRKDDKNFKLMEYKLKRMEELKLKRKEIENKNLHESEALDNIVPPYDDINSINDDPEYLQIDNEIKDLARETKNLKKRFDEVVGRTLSAKIYDKIIECFYLPNFTKVEEKEMYIGYFYYDRYIVNKDAEKDNSQKMINLSKMIPEYKVNNFVDYVLRCLEDTLLSDKKKDKKNIEKKEDSERKKKKKVNINILKNNYKHKYEEIRKIKRDNIDEADEKTKEILFDFFYVWDTIFNIFYGSSKKRIKEIRRYSNHYNKIKEIPYETLKTDLFNILFSQISKFDEEAENIYKQYDLPDKFSFTQTMKYLYKNYVLMTQNQIDFNQIDSAYLFYFDNSKLLLIDEPNDDLFLQEIQPKDTEVLKFGTYPQIFTILWDILPIPLLYNIFFGYNTCIENKFDRIIDYMFSEVNFFNSSDNAHLQPSIRKEIEKFINKRFDLYEYFRAEERAEILNMLEPGQKFMSLIRDGFVKLEEKIPSARNAKIYFFNDLLRFFKENRVNLLIKHNFYREIFQIYFSDVKDKIIDIFKNYNLKYKMYLQKYKELNPFEKILSSKFFGSIMTKLRFNYLESYFKKEKGNLENQNNALNEGRKIPNNEAIFERIEEISTDNKNQDINIEIVQEFDKDNIIKLNPFIWALSLEPYDYLDVCQKLKDIELREFYLCLYNYFYGFQSNLYSNYYLKKKIKLRFIEKYDHYVQFVHHKKGIEAEKINLEIKEDELKDALEYLDERRNQFENLLNKVNDDESENSQEDA